MKKILFCLSFLSLIFINQANAGDIAIINLEEIIKNSTAMSKVNKELENKKATIEKQLKAEETKLNEEKNSLEVQVKTLNEEKSKEKVLAFQEKVINFQKKVKDNEATLQKNYMNAVFEVTNNVKSIIAEMKSEKDSKFDFKVVLPISSVVYSDNNLDISSEVLKRLNKKLKTIKLSE